MKSIKIFQALVRPVRQMSAHAGPQKLPPVSPKFRAKQEYFQMDNGVLVHMRGGMLDRAMYYSLMAMITVGVIGVVAGFVKMAYPQKPK